MSYLPLWKVSIGALQAISGNVSSDHKGKSNVRNKWTIKQSLLLCDHASRGTQLLCIFLVSVSHGARHNRRCERKPELPVCSSRIFSDQETLN